MDALVRIRMIDSCVFITCHQVPVEGSNFSMEYHIRNNNQKSAFFWNSVASVLNSFQSAILLIFISHFGGASDAGIFVFAYAAANLMTGIGRFGMRQFQVSDTIDKYSFSEYLYSRKITTFVMLALSIPYALGSGAGNYVKVMTVLLWCGIRAIEVYEDVYHGYLQKNGLLNIGAKILSIRMFVSIIMFSLVYYLERNLLTASVINFLLAAVLALILNYRYRNLYPDSTVVDKRCVGRLFIENVSLFISSFCYMYLGNAPKYSINNVLSDEMQAVFGYMFMPVFLVNLLSNFILQPLLTTYSELWHNKNIKDLKSLIYRHFIVIVTLTIITVLGGKFIGIYLLEIIYNVSLIPYAHILYILLVASGLNAFMTYSRTLLTVVRYQNIALLGYIVACLAMLIGGRPALKWGGMTGISIYYSIVILLLNVYSFGIFIFVLRKDKANK